MPCFIDLSGRVFGQLTVVSRDTSRRGVYWWVVCSCGVTYSTRASNLTYEGSTMCRMCLNLKKSNDSKLKTHGLSKTSEYRTWIMMRSRCNNPTYTHYHYYGGRGITVCDAWNESFECFIRDMGRKPTPEHTIERIDNNGNYCPENCRWATREEQVDNRSNRVTHLYNGVEQTLREISNDVGVPRERLYAHMYRGKTLEQAIQFCVAGDIPKLV